MTPPKLPNDEFTLEDYRMTSCQFAVYPKKGEYPTGLMYSALGLAGESGEVADQVKKTWRNDGEMTHERRDKIFSELGDTLWYVAQVATEMGFNLQYVAEHNIAKLTRRWEEGTIKERPRA